MRQMAQSQTHPPCIPYINFRVLNSKILDFEISFKLYYKLHYYDTNFESIFFISKFI